MSLSNSFDGWARALQVSEDAVNALDERRETAGFNGELFRTLWLAGVKGGAIVPALTAYLMSEIDPHGQQLEKFGRDNVEYVAYLVERDLDSRITRSALWMDIIRYDDKFADMWLPSLNEQPRAIHGAIAACLGKAVAE